jgi:acetolactate synthase-1/2/3 large subunit
VNAERCGELLTGSEALAAVLREWGCSTVFAYPGTSELALCAALAGRAGMRLVNARGDGEAVFMAAGGNRLQATSCAAVVHGARGLTNALGAVADARRSEVPVPCLVGLPSRESARFLPPHGEACLIGQAGGFAVGSVDFSVMDGWDPGAFIALVREAVTRLGQAPRGPVLLGLPQDVLTRPFVPSELLSGVGAQPPSTVVPAMVEASVVLRSAERPVILVDDYLLGWPGGESALAEFADRMRAPVLQVAYRRGPMLFQQISGAVVRSFLGRYDPQDPRHRSLLEAADLLITVEDRNMYPRVVGPLPSCRTVAITSSEAATAKNGYLRAADVVLVGEIPAILRELSLQLPDGTGRSEDPSSSWRCRPSECCREGLPPTPAASSASADALARAVGRGLHGVRNLVIVDDGQMFGGLLARNYSHLPSGVRVFGSHGGFVGSGLPTAVGLAVAHPQATVVAALGDQGFTNAVQALAALRELQARVLLVVCNNGRSVSLVSQAATDGTGDGLDVLLGNVDGLSYAQIAHGFGIRSSTYAWPEDPGPGDLERAASGLSGHLQQVLSQEVPHVLELLAPDGPRFWARLWRVDGNEAILDRREPGLAGSGPAAETVTAGP